jgi:rfaE bifunctional protein nucleotidyltransferase chain/domain
MVSGLRYIDAVTSVSEAEAGAFLAGLKPYIWVTAGSQKHAAVYAVPLMASAERVVELPDQCGCFTEEIIRAMAEHRTPISLPVSSDAIATGGVPGGMGRVANGLVTVNGCFDILHVGHLRLLNEARAMGRSLTVLINSDASVARYKGTTRPVFPAAFRSVALKALSCVDEVVVFDGDNPLPEIGQLRPTIHVKGGSYEPDRVRTERELVESWGGQLRCTALVEGFSTTDYIRKALGLKESQRVSR